MVFWPVYHVTSSDTHPRYAPLDVTIVLKIKVLDCVIVRRRITIQPSPSSLAKNFILKPIADEPKSGAIKWNYFLP